MEPRWGNVRLGDELEILSGFPFNSQKFSSEEGIPLIRIRDLVDQKPETYFSGTYSSAYIIKKGDVVVGMDGDFNIVKWNGQESLLNQRLLKISAKQNGKVDGDYIFFYLQPFLLDVNTKTTATTVKHLSVYDIADAVVELPSIQEQRKIADILISLSREIDDTEDAIAKYQCIKQGLMGDFFTRGIDPATGKLRPAPNQAAKLYMESILGLVPTVWEMTCVENLCKAVINGGTPQTSIQRYWNGDIPWVTGADFLDTFEIGDIRRKITREAVKKSSSNVVPKGNILLVTRTGVGKLAIAPFDIAISQDITGIILNDKADIAFFYYYLQLLVEDFKKLNQGTSINGIVRSDLLSKVLFMPPMIEQILISERLQAVDKLISTEKSTLSKLLSLKKGLMRDLLTGKTRVKTALELTPTI